MTPASSPRRSSPRWFGLFLALFVTAVSAVAGERYTATTVEESGVTLVVLRDGAAGVEAAIAPGRGGELSSLRVLHRGEWLELLHRARDYRPAPGWRGKAPLLWPAVGRNFSRTQPPDPNAEMCSYDFAGRRYDLPIHGFARLHAWRVIETRADADSAAVEVELIDDVETRRQYPFGFNFRIVYRLAAGRLTLTHRIAAARENDATMFFSIGNHVTFRLPLVPGSAPGDTTLQTPSRTELPKDATTLPTGESRPLDLSQPSRLAEHSFLPPLGLAGYEGDPWLRLADPTGLAIVIAHRAERLPAGPCILFNLWGSPANGYFSPEPWVGLTDSLNRRAGLIELPPGETWEWEIDFRFEGR
jgi:galactose mutarotase-like enzyme